MLTYDRIDQDVWAVYHAIHGPLGLTVLQHVQRGKTIRRDWWVYRGADTAPTGRAARSRREAGLRLAYWWERLRDGSEPPTAPRVDPRPLRRAVLRADDDLADLSRQLQELRARLEIQPADSLTGQII